MSSESPRSKSHEGPNKDYKDNKKGRGGVGRDERTRDDVQGILERGSGQFIRNKVNDILDK